MLAVVMASVDNDVWNEFRINSEIEKLKLSRRKRGEVVGF